MIPHWTIRRWKKFVGYQIQKTYIKEKVVIKENPINATFAQNTISNLMVWSNYFIGFRNGKSTCVALHSLFTDRIRIWRGWFLRKKETRWNLRKNIGARMRTTNQLNQHVSQVRESNPCYSTGRSEQAVAITRSLRPITSQRIHWCLNSFADKVLP